MSSPRAIDSALPAGVLRAPAKPGLAAAVLVSLVATSCVPSLQDNPPRDPHREVPGGFGGAAQATTAAQQKWSQIFSSPELQELIATALNNNQELNLQLQEIIIARNEAYARTGEYMPRVEGVASVGIEKVGEHTSQGVGDEQAGLAQNLGDFSFGLRGSWELDVWRKMRNGAKAANLRYLATIEARNFVVTQLIAEIARSYFELMAIDNQLEILTRNIEIQTNALEVVRLQWQAAKVTELAVQRFEAEVLKNQSKRYELEQEKVRTENRINFLVGRYPQPIRRDSVAFRQATPPPIGVGLPSDLLTNRPDVRAAELALEASKLDVASAKAAFYPSFMIDAELGYRAFNPIHLIATPASLAYRFAGGMVAPLINRRAITAQYRTANAMQLQAVIRYEQTVLQAFTDVANQLAVIDNLAKAFEFQQQQVDKLAKAVETSNLLFQSTRADYMEVLLTRRDSVEAEIELVETKKQQFLAMVNVYQALGGGWRASGAAPGATANRDIGVTSRAHGSVATRAK
jgi:outer membrane protein, multidrug efflux system